MIAFVTGGVVAVRSERDVDGGDGSKVPELADRYGGAVEEEPSFENRYTS